MAPNSASKKTAAATETAGAENGVASEVHNLEDMKSLVEKQNDTIKAQKVEKRENLNQAIHDWLHTEGPALLEVVVEQEGNVFPMVPSGASVAEIRLN